MMRGALFSIFIHTYMCDYYYYDHVDGDDTLL